MNVTTFECLLSGVYLSQDYHSRLLYTTTLMCCVHLSNQAITTLQERVLYSCMLFVGKHEQQMCFITCTIQSLCHTEVSGCIECHKIHQETCCLGSVWSLSAMKPATVACLQ